MSREASMSHSKSTRFSKKDIVSRRVLIIRGLQVAALSAAATVTGAKISYADDYTGCTDSDRNDYRGGGKNCIANRLPDANPRDRRDR